VIILHSELDLLGVSIVQRWGTVSIPKHVVDFSRKIIDTYPIGSMYGIYTNIGGILMVNVTIYGSTMDPMGMGFDFKFQGIDSNK